MTMTWGSWAAAVVALALGGCARERVRVADVADAAPVQAGDSPPPPSFEVPDGDRAAPEQRDGGRCTAVEPILGACAPCPGGYLIVDGEPTCTCCDD